jgi:2-hydroxychromene-2-carboxylate isomerase
VRRRAILRADEPSDGAPVDFFFYIGSLYSYLSVMRIDAAAAQAGVAVRWRPFSVRNIMIEQENLPTRNAAKIAYMHRDLERRAERLGIPLTPGMAHPVDPEQLANRVAIVAAQQGWCPPFTKAIFANWMQKHDQPGDPDQLRALLTELGQDADAVIAQAQSEEAQRAYDAETDAAKALGIFGAPSFVVGTELFWGDDRLEDALAWAQAH